MATIKRNIRSLSFKELESYLSEKKFESFRAKQVNNWIWGNNPNRFSDMTNLPKSLINNLESDFILKSLKIHETQKSVDKTIKIAFQLEDKTYTEGVLIPSEKRLTACISSQTGCPLGCKFCASGKITNYRNLEKYEIIEQIFDLNDIAKDKYNNSLTNIVIMGIGEPLLNYDNVLWAINKIIAEWSWSPSRITLSTAGMINEIYKLAKEKTGIKLAISLHSADQNKRTMLMPINKKYPLEKLKKAITEFNKYSKKAVTLEYLMLKDINDSSADAKKLVLFCKGLNVKINLIEYNNTSEAKFKNSDSDTINEFMKILTNNNIPVTLRKSKGKDIDAACGQLTGGYMPEK
ncbi:MAG: 23S rRNA (adenine(2503)-C(2))-methyltransferase RlmN [Marinilabiliales bacterium]